MASYKTSIFVSTLLVAFVSASGCLAPQEDFLDELSGAEEPKSVELSHFIPQCQTQALQGIIYEDCPSDDPADPNACDLICSTSSHCDTQCSLSGYPYTCGIYGLCQEPCSHVCTGSSRCDRSCYQNGVPTTCGQSGVCSPPPDCLVEFWTGYGYTGARDCYGTKADVERVLASGGRLDITQVSRNDQYSSFRTIEQVCQDRGISPCHLAGVPNKVKTGATRVYKDANFSGKSKQFPEWVNGDSDFDNDLWYDAWLQGDIDEKISSFFMGFSVAPTCYKAYRDSPSCGLCLDGGAWLQPFECTNAANPLTGEGWIKVDTAKNVWVFFYPGTYSPASVGYNGNYRLYLKQYNLVYPAPSGSQYGIEWRVQNNPTTLWFENSVPGSF